jgi:hypothetical protein
MVVFWSQIELADCITRSASIRTPEALFALENAFTLLTNVTMYSDVKTEDDWLLMLRSAQMQRFSLHGTARPAQSQPHLLDSFIIPLLSLQP